MHNCIDMYKNTSVICRNTNTNTQVYARGMNNERHMHAVAGASRPATGRPG